MSDPIPSRPAAPSSASDADHLLLARAANLHQPLARAARLGRANGTGYVVFGALSLMLALMDPDAVGIALGVVLLGVGLVERHQCGRLVHADPRAPQRLATAELTLLAAIVIYGILGLTVLPSASEAIKRQIGDSQGLGVDLSKLADSVRQSWYASVILISLLYQGGMARYFLRRRDAVAFYRAEVPDWAREVVESMTH